MFVSILRQSRKCSLVNVLSLYRSHFQSHKLHTNVVAGEVSFFAGPEVAVDALADPGA